jgi:hypothetical protein
MRLAAAMFAAAALAAFATGAASASPAASAKLTPAEQKWAKPVVGLWNIMNTGLQNVVPAATAKNALVLGSANNKKLVTLLVTFALCPETLTKAGKPPTRLARIATTMSTACARLDAGSKTFGKALTAISKGQQTRGSSLVLQAVGSFKKAKSPLASVRTQLIAIGSKNIFA